MTDERAVRRVGRIVVGFICHCQPAHYEQRCNFRNAIARSISNHSRRCTLSLQPAFMLAGLTLPFCWETLVDATFLTPFAMRSELVVVLPKTTLRGSAICLPAGTER